MRPPGPDSIFDVERFRSEPLRSVQAPDVARPTLVLGSTQPAELVDRVTLRERGVTLVRRRGGGGAVYLEPGHQLWMDAWIPRGDPLWQLDVSAAAEWVGAWWIDALAGLGLGGFEVHTGRSVPGELGEVACFAGRGPGEVFFGGRKVVGLSQWRAREGALFSSNAYLQWDPTPMVGLFDAGERARGDLARRLAGVAVGLSELTPGLRALAPVRERLLGSFPTFGA